MTELEKLQKVNIFLKDAVDSSKTKIGELKQDVKELQDEIRLLAQQRACPALLEARETIKELKKQIQAYKDYERNSLLREKDNAPD